MRRLVGLGLGLLLMATQAHAAEDLETAFKERIGGCKGNAKGTMRVLDTSVSEELKPRLPTLDLQKYCECYWGRLRDKFGLKATIYMTTMIGTLPGDPTLEAAYAFQNTYAGTWEWMQTGEKIQNECVREHSRPVPAPPTALREESLTEQQRKTMETKRAVYGERRNILTALVFYYSDFKRVPKQYSELVSAGFLSPDESVADLVEYKYIDETNAEVCLKFEPEPDRPHEPKCERFTGR